MNSIESNARFISEFETVSNKVHEIAKSKGWWNQETPEEWYEEECKEGGALMETEYGSNEIMLAYEAGQKNPERNEGEMIALMHSELSEGLEGLRKNLASDHIEGFSMIEEEFADVIIRIMDHAKKHGYRVGEAIIRKIEFNAGREYKHGGKKF